MTFSECVAAISAATGYPVQYTQIPIETSIDGLRAQGAPDPLLWLMRELFTVVFDGRNSVPASGVEEALVVEAADGAAALVGAEDAVAELGWTAPWYVVSSVAHSGTRELMDQVSDELDRIAEDEAQARAEQEAGLHAP